MGVFRLDTKTIPNTLGAIEMTSVAQGYVVADLMLKKAPITLLDARPYCPGKFMVLVTGDVSSIEESLKIGKLSAGTSFFAELFVPQLIPSVIFAINRENKITIGESIGILESFSALSIIDAANEVCKSVDVEVESLSLLEGLGGKAFVIFTGILANIQSALEIGIKKIPEDMIVSSQIVSQVSQELLPFLPGSNRHVHG
jgi:microcompartment protein CcmL/EutN